MNVEQLRKIVSYIRLSYKEVDLGTKIVGMK